MDPVKIREINFLKKGDTCLQGQKMTSEQIDGLPKTWERIKQDSDWEERLKNVEEFNKKNKFIKRGIYVNFSHLFFFLLLTR